MKFDFSLPFDRAALVRPARHALLVLALGPLTTALASADNPISRAQASDGHQGVIMSATGGGHLLIAGVFDTAFSFNAKQKVDGTASGQFRYSVELDGLAVDFHGKVNCMSVDQENRRAWIGGVVTSNRSVHPDFTTEIHQPGRDIWFRVLDNGKGGAADMDRSTFVGFEGGGGIITSQEYCETAIWPDDNARTSPVTQGNIQVRP